MEDGKEEGNYMKRRKKIEKRKKSVRGRNGVVVRRKDRGEGGGERKMG